MQATMAQPPASPFQMAGSPLFRTSAGESIEAPPINAPSGLSPFGMASAAPTNMPLTVGDVIHLLPPELVRGGSVSPEQPLTLQPALLENALRSGQPSVPVFEIYRVCPALFQGPVSPQDPRTVALPVAKLSALIAGTRTSAPALPAAAQASPFAAAEPSRPPTAPPSSAFPMSPFAAAMPSNPIAGGASPFGQASASASPFAASSPPPLPTSSSPFAQSNAAPASPFAAASPHPAASPFGAPPSNPAPASPFAAASPPPAASHFGAPPSNPASASPFAAASPPPAASPFGAAPSNPASASPFAAASPPPAASPFGAAPSNPAPASPFAAASPAPAASPFGAAASAQSSPFGAMAPSAEPASVLSAGASPFASVTPSVFASPAPSDASSPSLDPVKHGTTGLDRAMATLFAAKPAEPPAPAPSLPPMEAPGLTMPLAQPQPAKSAAAPMMAPPAEGASPVFSGTAGSAGGKARFTLATLLQGCSADNLGFNPATVPAWLSTSIEASLLNEQASTGAYAVSLGTLLDGVADLGFRNMLSGAKRDVQIQLPANEVFHALTASQDSGASTSAPALAAVAAPAVTMPKMMVSPASGGPPAEAAAPAPPAASPMFAASAAPSPSPSPAAPITFTPFGSPGPSSTGILPSTPPASASPVSAPAQPAPSPAHENSFFASLTPQPAEPAQNSASTPAAAPFPMAPEAPKSPFPALSPTVQPLAGAFNAFATPPVEAAPAASRPIQPTVKAFDPFAPSAATGLSSEQLLGVAPTTPTSSATGSLFRPTQPTQPLIDPFATQREVKTASIESIVPLISAEPKPSAFFGASMGTPSENAPTRPMLAPAMVPPPGPISNPFTAPQEAPPTPSLKLPPAPAPSPATAPAPSPASATLSPLQPKTAAPSKASFLGLSALDTDTDQLLLRALLGVEDTLDASRVVQLLATQPGLSACICLNGSSVLSHADPSAPEAATFQQQAPDIARQLKGLAPLIGIEGAETFTLNAGGRLLTFCFPGEVTVGVLHQGEPGTGLRDKITLVARELARLLR